MTVSKRDVKLQTAKGNERNAQRAMQRMIQKQFAWIREYREGGGDLIDPYAIAVNDFNPGLQRLFAQTRLDRRRATHWRLLCAELARVIYERTTVLRETKWTVRSETQMVRDVYERRTSKKHSVGAIFDDIRRSPECPPQYKTFATRQAFENKFATLIERCRKQLDSIRRGGKSKPDWLDFEDDELGRIVSMFPRGNRRKSRKAREAIG